MYQSILRDPGGDSVVRILSCTTVVNGSILIVPADAVAYFVCNGLISREYPSGRHIINTGVSPFFVRLRNLMTNGDPGMSVSIFFVNNHVETVFSSGTGEIVFKEQRFNISMKAMAGFTIRYTITEPYSFLQKLVGMHQDTFYEEDIHPAIESILKPLVRESVAKYLSRHNIHEFQNDLVDMGNRVQTPLQTQLRTYGISLNAFSLLGVNIPDGEMGRLNKLEEQYAKGLIETDIELDNIKRVYGDVNKRTLVEVATGSIRGSTQTPGASHTNPNMSGMLVALPIQLVIANRLASEFGGVIDEMMGQVHMGDSNQSNSSHANDGEERNQRNRRHNTPDLPPQ